MTVKNLRGGQSLFLLKGTETIIFSDPLGKDVNVQFTRVPLKALSDQA